ncbi:uncharacterized protein LOC119663929, partial [Teleopsis dalmanni]|uniref:uncharacterized protein LOC119663929 n=1 Tax=Teleopsis dalmanni TaxID=139649 RepID=UPI0018CF4305
MAPRILNFKLASLTFEPSFVCKQTFKFCKMSNEIRKRKRDNEVKKWTEEEIKKVLCYMQEHRNIEKPTAQLYYKQLLAETNINANWNILKCKVRHLKSTLQKADAWINSTGAGVEDDDNTITVKDKVVKICPHYEQLVDIFSPSKEIEFVVMDTSNALDCTLDAIDLEEDSVILDGELSASSETISFENKVKRTARPTCIDKLKDMESDRVKFRKEQLILEIEKFEWTKEMEKQKLELERQKVENEFKLKKLELEQKE